jgi:hypothetical protein
MNKNLIIKISNGFGNQMFTYASAYAFSKKLGYNLLVDNESGVKHDLIKWNKKKRINWKPSYELGIFKLRSDIAPDSYKFLNTPSNLKRKYFKFVDNFYFKKRFLIEKMNNNKKTYYSNKYLFQKYHNTIYMEGYFESEKYFYEHRNDLLKEFTFKSIPNLKDNIFANMINNSNVVSIAFRSRRFTELEGDDRDKLKQQKTRDFENKTVEYIYRGIEYFKNKINNPKFLLWSDNFENLNKYFDPYTFTFVKNNNQNKIILDFFLMQQCKNFIIGPTSFHWWAAWLSSRENKIVLCPKNKDLNVSSNNDFWPESWIKI